MKRKTIVWTLIVAAIGAWIAYSYRYKIEQTLFPIYKDKPATVTLRFAPTEDGQFRVELVDNENIEPRMILMSAHQDPTMDSEGKWAGYQHLSGNFRNNDEPRVLDAGVWKFEIQSNDRGTPKRTIILEGDQPREEIFVLKPKRRVTFKFEDAHGIPIPWRLNENYQPPIPDEEQSPVTVGVTLQGDRREERGHLEAGAKLTLETFGGKIRVSLRNGRYQALDNNRFEVDLDHNDNDEIVVACVPAVPQVMIIRATEEHTPMFRLEWSEERLKSEYNSGPSVGREYASMWQGRSTSSMSFVDPGQYVLRAYTYQPLPDEPSKQRPLPNPNTTLITIPDVTGTQVWEWRGSEEGFFRLK